MNNLKDKSALVIDYGYMLPFAERLARDYGEVFYCTTWQSAFPKPNQYSIGMNVNGIKRVDSPFEVIDDVDVICFPDLFFGTFADWLRDRKYNVFGAGSGECMELYRDEFKELLKEVGLPVNEYKTLKGYTKLEKYLKDKEDCYVKVDLIRGLTETFHYKNLKLSESRLLKLKHDLGSFKEYATFVVEEPIKDCVEIGLDTFAINGEYPEKHLFGVEIKDCGYAGMIIGNEKVPKVLSDINKKLAPTFKEYNYACNYSNEVRWNGKVGYLIDQTCRLPNPPSFLQMEIFDNYSEIIDDVANGKVPEIKASKKYGVQCIIKSTWASIEPQAIYFDEKYKNNIKIQNLMCDDKGTYYYVPLTEEHEEVGIGSVVATGNSLDEAIKLAEKIAKTIEGDGINIDCSAMYKAQEEINKLKKFNIYI